MTGHSSAPVRVALMASSLRLGGAEKQFVYMARALLETGMDAHVFSWGDGGPFEAILRQQRIPLHRLGRPNHPWLILAAALKALRRFQPHLVLASQFGDLIHAGLAGRCCRSLTLGGVRSDGVYELNSNGSRSRWMLRLPHGLIANSNLAKQNLVAAGLSPERIQVVPNVLALREFDARATRPVTCSLPPNRPLVAAVGSLQPCKRLDRFLAGLALARQTEPALCGLLVGGDQGVKAALEEQAGTLGLGPEHLLLLGESEEIPALLARVQALVLCSDYEGFPNVLLEAMAARRPVISTPVGDAPRIVREGVTGYLVAGDDTKALADRLVRLARCPELRARLGEAGRQCVEAGYSFETLAGRLLSSVSVFARQQQSRSLLERLPMALDFG